jgi:hypothetical protein
MGDGKQHASSSLNGQAVNGRPHRTLAGNHKPLVDCLEELRRDLRAAHAQADARIEYLIQRARQSSAAGG